LFFLNNARKISTRTFEDATKKKGKDKFVFVEKFAVTMRFSGGQAAAEPHK